MDKERGDECTWWQLITGRGPSGAVRRMILGAWMQCMNQLLHDLCLYQRPRPQRIYGPGPCCCWLDRLPHLLFSRLVCH
ncbi:hypothetical protein LB505_012523 [Fusarium chuoi]|nr:hypothetical protein LB505_012523 [Fusarium chuoi]